MSKAIIITTWKEGKYVYQLHRLTESEYNNFKKEEGAILNREKQLKRKIETQIKKKLIKENISNGMKKFHMKKRVSKPKEVKIKVNSKKTSKKKVKSKHPIKSLYTLKNFF